MPSFENLKEEIREVYHIFDEDEAGNMTINELARALYTVTGERLPRSALRKLVAAARESLAQRNEDDGADAGQQVDTKSNDSTPTSSPYGTPKLSAVSNGRAASIANSAATSRTLQSRNTNSVNVVAAEEGIDAATFEEIVLRKLNSRNAEEEIAYTFALLEDQYYPGFITKESLLRAAQDAEEPLTQAELGEMFDALVTGAPTAAVDLITFRSVQEAARKAHELEVREVMEEEEAQEAEKAAQQTSASEAMLSSLQMDETGGASAPAAAADVVKAASGTAEGPFTSAANSPSQVPLA